jgi:hypothetical protein
MLVVIIGLALAVVYGALTARWLVHHGYPLDRTTLVGLREAAENLRPDNFRRWAAALLVPVLLLIYTLPASAAMAILSRRSVRDRLAPATFDTVALILTGVLTAWLIGLVTGMHNVRYGYPTLPIVALLPGAMIGSLERFDDRQRSQLRAVVTVATLAWFGAILALAGWSITHAGSIALMVATVAIAGVVTVWALHALVRHRSFRGLAGWIVLVPLLAIPFADFNVADRWRKSGIHAAPILRDTIGVGQPCLAGGMLRFQPELFHYAGVACRSTSESIPRPSDLRASTWLVLKEDEYEKWYRKDPHVTRAVPFQSYTERGVMVYFER